MAQEWYLLNSPYSQLSGYETDAFDECAQEGFYEALDSGLAFDIELCNYDLSQRKKVRGIVFDNTQETKLKTLSREILLPIGSCKAGMYIYYDERYWLIIGIVGNKKIYEKVVATYCNYLLTWINDRGKIIQRWANVLNGSQYNSGINERETFYAIRNDQLFVSIPDDDECVMLSNDKRFIIDRRCKVYEKQFDSNTTKDVSKPLVTYKLTRPDSVLNDYQNSGYYVFLATEDEKHNDDGYYMIDGKGYWLCDIPTENGNKTEISSSKIDCDSLTIYNGLDSGVFIGRFFDDNGNEAVAYPNWEIRGEYADKLKVEYRDNSICISANNKKLINKSFELFLSSDGYESSSVIFNVRDFI